MSLAIDRNTIDHEYLLYAKSAVQKGVRRFAIPITLAYIIVDYFHAPAFFAEFLVARILCVVGTFGFQALTLRAQTLKDFMGTYVWFMASFSVATNYYVFRIGNPPDIYWAGLALVGIGGLGFFPFSKKFSIGQLAFLFLPGFIYMIKYLETPVLIGQTVTYFIFSIATVFIVMMFRDFHDDLLRGEIMGRFELQAELEKRSRHLKDAAEALNQTKDELLKSSELSQRASRLAAIAKQTAHDIRSPLSALSVVTKSLHSLSGDHRRLAQAAIDRIMSVADELLVSAKGKEIVKFAAAHKVSILIADIIKEKEASSRKHISYSLDCEDEEIRVFAEKDHLLRIISNIVQNSIDSISGTGEISISVAGSGESEANILIVDNGCGIPQEILAKLGDVGVSFGKEHGNGLGLSHAIQMAQQWGGRLTVDSELGKGTKVNLFLRATKRFG